MVNKPLIRPAISWGGTLGGGRLTSHDDHKGPRLFLGVGLGFRWQPGEVRPLLRFPMICPDGFSKQFFQQRFKITLRLLTLANLAQKNHPVVLMANQPIP